MKADENNQLKNDDNITGILKEDFPELYEILKDCEVETNVCGEEFRKKFFAAAAAKMEENRRLKALELEQSNAKVKNIRTILDFFSTFGFYQKTAFATFAFIVLLISSFFLLRFLGEGSKNEMIAGNNKPPIANPTIGGDSGHNGVVRTANNEKKDILKSIKQIYIEVKSGELENLAKEIAKEISNKSNLDIINSDNSKGAILSISNLRKNRILVKLTDSFGEELWSMEIDNDNKVELTISNSLLTAINN